MIILIRICMLSCYALYGRKFGSVFTVQTTEAVVHLFHSVSFIQKVSTFSISLSVDFFCVDFVSYHFLTIFYTLSVQLSFIGASEQTIFNAKVSLFAWSFSADYYLYQCVFVCVCSKPIYCYSNMLEQHECGGIAPFKQTKLNK